MSTPASTDHVITDEDAELLGWTEPTEQSIDEITAKYMAYDFVKMTYRPGGLESYQKLRDEAKAAIEKLLIQAELKGRIEEATAVAPLLKRPGMYNFEKLYAEQLKHIDTLTNKLNGDD